MKLTPVKMLTKSNYSSIDSDARGATYDLTPGFAPIYTIVQLRNPHNAVVLTITSGPAAGTYTVNKGRIGWLGHNGYFFIRSLADGTEDLSDVVKAAAVKIQREQQLAQAQADLETAQAEQEALITPGELSILRTLIGLPVVADDGVYGIVEEIAPNGIVIIDCTVWANTHNPVQAGAKKGYKYSQLTHRHLDSFLARAPETITDAQAMQSNTLQQIAVIYLATYQGTNSFTQNVAEHLDRKGAISYKQTRAVLNTLLRDYRAIRAEDKADALQLAKKEGDSTIVQAHYQAYRESPSRAAFALSYDDVPMVQPSIQMQVYGASIEGKTQSTHGAIPTIVIEPLTDTPVLLPDGTYTVVFNDAGEYRTFSIDSDVSWHHTAKPGDKAVYYLTGADNTRDFTFYALLTGGDRFIPKQTLRNARDLSFALTKLLQPDAFLIAGKTYAMRTNRCFVCNKTLSTPDSIASGIGPICAANNGIDQAALAALNITEQRKEQQRSAQAGIDELFPE